MTAIRILWALPNTLLGLFVGSVGLLSGGRVRRIESALEFYGGFVSWALRRFPFPSGGASAMTLGHVILGQSDESLDSCRSHEHIHVRQYERWGPFFLPAYLGCSAWLWLRSKNPYFDNPFEREAYRDQ